MWVASCPAVPNLDLPGGGSEEDTFMRLVFPARPAQTEESHRVTPFEIFCDLVFVFALIQVTAFMAKPPTLLLLVQGLVVVLLLPPWLRWCPARSVPCFDRPERLTATGARR